MDLLLDDPSQLLTLSQLGSPTSLEIDDMFEDLFPGATPSTSTGKGKRPLQPDQENTQMEEASQQPMSTPRRVRRSPSQQPMPTRSPFKLLENVPMPQQAPHQAAAAAPRAAPRAPRRRASRAKAEAPAVPDADAAPAPVLGCTGCTSTCCWCKVSPTWGVTKILLFALWTLHKRDAGVIDSAAWARGTGDWILHYIMKSGRRNQLLDLVCKARYLVELRARDGAGHPTLETGKFRLSPKGLHFCETEFAGARKAEPTEAWENIQPLA